MRAARASFAAQHHNLKRLRVHGLIKKVGRTYKYYLTQFGKDIVATGLKLLELVVIPQLAFGHLA